MAEAKKEEESPEEKKAKKKEKMAKKCPVCGKESVVRDYQRGIIICENCGNIVKEDIKDRGPEWRAFDQKQREKNAAEEGHQ